MEPTHPLLQMLCSKGLNVDECMDVIGYCMTELGKHSKPSPETVHLIDTLSKRTEVIEKRTEGIEDVVAFVRVIMEDKKWWEGLKKRTAFMFTYGRSIGAIIFSVVAGVLVLKGWLGAIILWAVSDLRTK
jgi:hypothetical protein